MNGIKSAKIKDLKKGEFVRRTENAKKTYKRGEYNPAAKRFYLDDCDDISRALLLKGETVVFYDFEY